MIGGGPFDLRPGEWTDDTSMALCLGTSLLHARGFDAGDQMNRYCAWWKDGELSSNGRCFDIGNTVRQALTHFQQSGDPFSGSTDPHAAGNGSIMRLAPVPMFYSSDEDAVVHFSGESSRTTHGAAECIDACRYFGLLLHRALLGVDKKSLLATKAPRLVASPAVLAIADGCYRAKSADDIRGAGYVIQSLEAALWCFSVTNTFEEAVLAATTLGDDADTTAAVCGQIAGAFYGAGGIPSAWLQRLAMVDFLRDMSDRLQAAADRV